MGRLMDLSQVLLANGLLINGPLAHPSATFRSRASSFASIRRSDASVS